MDSDDPQPTTIEGREKGPCGSVLRGRAAAAAAAGARTGPASGALRSLGRPGPERHLFVIVGRIYIEIRPFVVE